MAQWQPSTFTPDKTADTAAYAASLSASATSHFTASLKEGQRLSRIEDILELLSEIGCIPDDIRERITSETHLDTLKQWSRNAARCQNLEEFIERM